MVQGNSDPGVLQDSTRSVKSGMIPLTGSPGEHLDYSASTDCVPERVYAQRARVSQASLLSPGRQVMNRRCSDIQLRVWGGVQDNVLPEGNNI